MMMWTVFLLCDSEGGVTWAQGHFEAEDAESAAHAAYAGLVGDVEPTVLEVIVLSGFHRNALGRRKTVVKMELNG